MRRKLSIKNFQNYFLLLLNRKVKLPGYNKIFFISLFTIVISVHANGQYTTKVVDFDLEKKHFTEGKSRFPFDEPFTFRVINLPEGSVETDLNITIEDISPKNKIDENPIELKCIITDGSREFSGVVKSLPPNHSFKIDISGETKRKPNEEETKKLRETLSSDELIMKFLPNNFEYSKLSEYKNRLQSSLSEKGFRNYKIDFSKLDEQGENAGYLADARRTLRNIAANLNEIENGLINVLENADKNNEIKRYFSDLYKEENGHFILTIKNNESNEKFVKRFNLDSLEKVITKNLIDTESDSTKKANLKSIVSNNIKGLGAIKDKVSRFEANFEDWIEKEIKQIIIDNIFVISVLGNNIYGTADSKASIYTSQTFGYGYSPKTDNGLMYFTFSFYARPVNNNVPLNYATGKGAWLLVRTCLNIGLTLEDINTNKNGTVSGLGNPFGSKAGLVGIGFRPWSFLKIDINSLLYYKKDPNPLITNKKFTASPLFGVSLNLNMLKLLLGQPNSLTKLTDEINNNKNP